MINGVILQIVLTADSSANTVNQVLTVLPTVVKPAAASLSAIDLAMKGGPVMIPIALLFILGIYIFIHRYIRIIRASKEDADFMNNIRDFMHNNRLDSALSICQNNNTPIARMVEKGLQRIGRPLNDINAAIENIGSIEVGKLEKNISLLATIAGAAPMLGFLGTVLGFVDTFYEMSSAGSNLDIQTLSSGIYQAMIATIAGLITGIIAYFCYNILVARIQKIVLKLQLRATEFMDMLHEPAK
jgi:biopolymer transport protein ExbB